MMSLYTNLDLLEMLHLPAEERSDQDVDKFIPWLRSRCGILEKIEEGVARDIIKNCTVETFITNEVIIRFGESGDSFYVVLNGSVSVWLGRENEERSSTEAPQIYMVQGKRMAKNKESFGNCLATLGIGHSFGELALLNEDCIRMASVLSDEQTTLMVINRKVFNRSLKGKKLREHKEKIDYVNTSIYFVNTSYKLRRDIAMSLKKETIYYGHTLVRQGDPIKKLYFVSKGQLRLQLNGSALRQTLTKHTLKITSPCSSPVNCRVRAIGQKSFCRFQSQINKVQDVCLLSGGDCIGDLEVAAGLNTITHTVIVEETATCFTLPVATFDKLVKSRSVKTMATFQKMALLRVEGRLNLSSNENQQVLLRNLLSKIQAGFKETCRGDKMLARIIDISLTRHKAGSPSEEESPARPGTASYRSQLNTVAAAPPSSSSKEAFNMLMRKDTFCRCKPKRVHSARHGQAALKQQKLSKALSLVSLLEQTEDTENNETADQNTSQ